MATANTEELVFNKILLVLDRINNDPVKEGILQFLIGIHCCLFLSDFILLKDLKEELVKCLDESNTKFLETKKPTRIIHDDFVNVDCLIDR